MLKVTNHISKDSINYVKLNRDLSLTLHKNPGLMIFYDNNIPCKIYGNFKIKDDDNVEQGNWDIEIPIPKRYPFEFPQLIETSEKILRNDDNHISPTGVACTELSIIADHVSKKGITITDFIDKYVFKYFCWHLLKENGEINGLKSWDHSDKGIKDFFFEIVGTRSEEFILRCLEILLNRNIPSRNNKCFCGSGSKYKRCHADKMKILDGYGFSVLKYIPLFKNPVK